MAIISKTYDLYPWRTNNIKIVAVSEENNGRTVQFNLYPDDTKSYTISLSDATAYLYVYNGINPVGIQGNVSSSDSSVSFNLSKALLLKEGHYSCVVAIRQGNDILKFAGMTLCILNGRTEDGYIPSDEDLNIIKGLKNNINSLNSDVDSLINEVSETKTSYDGIHFESLKQRLDLERESQTQLRSEVQYARGTYPQLKNRLNAIEEKIENVDNIPSLSVEQTTDGVIITVIKDQAANGYKIANGKDYVITQDDKLEIAQMAVDVIDNDILTILGGDTVD